MKKINLSPNEHKICSKCKRELPLSKFNRSAKSPSGLRSDCKDCQSIYNKKWTSANADYKRERDKQYRVANADKIKKTHRLWLANNLDKKKESNRKWVLTNPEKNRESHHKYYKNNSERICKEQKLHRGINPQKHRELVRRWQATHPEKRREIDRKWAANHPEKIKAKIQRQRAQRLNVEGSFSAIDILSLLKLQENRCFYCGNLLYDTQIDHFIPISRGGNNYKENIVLACGKCNRSKSDKLPQEFSKWNGNYPPLLNR